MSDVVAFISAESNAEADVFSMTSVMHQKGDEGRSEQQLLINNGLKKIQELDKALKQKERIHSINRFMISDALSELCITDVNKSVSDSSSPFVECAEGKPCKGEFFLTETASTGNNTATTSSITEGYTTETFEGLSNSSACANAILRKGSLVARNRELLRNSRASSLTASEEERVELLLHLNLDEKVYSNQLDQRMHDVSLNILNFGGYELTSRLKEIDERLENDFGTTIGDYEDDGCNDVLRTYARKRDFAQKQKNIDEALDLLEDAPIPVVVRNRNYSEAIQEKEGWNSMFPKYFDEEDVRNVLDETRIELKEIGEEFVVGDNDIRNLLFELGHEVESQVMENKRSSPDL